MVKSVVGLVFGILLLIFSVFGIVGSVTGLLTWSSAKDAIGMFGDLVQLPPDWYFYFTTLLSLVLSVAGLIIGIGLLMTRDWARITGIYLSWASIGLGLLNIILLFVLGLFLLATSSLLGFVTGAVFYGLMIYFLTRNNVKQEFA